MPKVFLMFVVALFGLLAGALFYAARLPVQVAETEAPPTIEPPPAVEVVSHPVFAMPDMEGKVRESWEWDGTHRVINFWATWCGPCRREIPMLKAFQDEHSEDGFQVIGIAVDYADEVVRYAEQAEFNYPILVGEQEAMALAQSSGVYFAGLPFTMFLASDGEYVGSYIGELHQEHLDTVVDVMTRLDSNELSKEAAKEALKLL